MANVWKHFPPIPLFSYLMVFFMKGLKLYRTFWSRQM